MPQTAPRSLYQFLSQLPFSLNLGHAVNLAIITQIFVGCEVIVESISFEDEADLFSSIITSNTLAENVCLTGIGLKQPQDNSDSGSLACSVRAKIAKNITLFYSKADILENLSSFQLFINVF